MGVKMIGCDGCTCHDDERGCRWHGISASNARQNDYWRRVGGHPPPDYQDYEDDDDDDRRTQTK